MNSRWNIDKVLSTTSGMKVINAPAKIVTIFSTYTLNTLSHCSGAFRQIKLGNSRVEEDGVIKALLRCFTCDQIANVGAK